MSNVISARSFASPPVVELSLSVQFGPLAQFHAAHMGLLWERFRPEFPKTEEQVPLPHVLEEFGSPAGLGPQIRVELVGRPPTPRCWFLNLDGTEVIQVQPDRFGVNWRKADGGSAYPRFSHVRQLFVRTFESFTQFVGGEQLGQVEADQCELMYVDHMEPNEVWQRHGQLDSIFTIWSDLSGKWREPESARVNIRYAIPDTDGKPIGRMHIELQPGYRLPDLRPIIVMNTTARGRPPGAQLDGVLAFFDQAHKWVLEGFLAITTPEIQRTWGIRDG